MAQAKNNNSVRITKTDDRPTGAGTFVRMPNGEEIAGISEIQMVIEPQRAVAYLTIPLTGVDISAHPLLSQKTLAEWVSQDESLVLLGREDFDGLVAAAQKNA